jgi:hypothetical protein
MCGVVVEDWVRCEDELVLLVRMEKVQVWKGEEEGFYNL